jgi:hypothetical protein
MQQNAFGAGRSRHDDRSAMQIAGLRTADGFAGLGLFTHPVRRTRRMVFRSGIGHLPSSRGPSSPMNAPSPAGSSNHVTRGSEIIWTRDHPLGSPSRSIRLISLEYVRAQNRSPT